MEIVWWRGGKEMVYGLSDCGDLREGNDQERVGEWKWIPRTMPEVVGLKDLSKKNQGGASLT
jgi:hypothetical protein